MMLPLFGQTLRLLMNILTHPNVDGYSFCLH